MGSRGWFVLEESVDPLREHVLDVYGRKRVLVINLRGGHMMVVVERGFEGGDA